ncbi:hypothetical protein R1sor_009359 [Riccia sorocarpa]|uniref:Uncharacterized protein n=1 Tax=Riccia sorocarpa TaxID=122646 RepID=A0ABD3HUX1_9MARC
MGSSEKIGEAEALQATETTGDCLSSPSCSAHDITSMSDLLPRRMKTKMSPMAPIETFTEEEVLAIANRDKTPVMIATLDGDTNGEQYLCGNKRGASLPPEIAAEGSWAQKYYQQKGDYYECDFRTHRQADYYTVLKNYTAGRFNSLDPDRLRSVEELLTAGETYLMQHARTNGSECPSEVQTAFQEFVPLKKVRNQYSHPLTLSGKTLASTVLRKLRVSLLNDEFDFIKGTKNLMLLGADYAETVLENYGKLRDKLFLDPNKRCPQRFQITYSQGPSPIHSPGPHRLDLTQKRQPQGRARKHSSSTSLSMPGVLKAHLIPQLRVLRVHWEVRRTRPRSPQDTSFPTDQSQSTDAQQSSETIRSPRPHKRPRL